MKENEDNKDKQDQGLVPSVGSQLALTDSDLIHRGLQDLPQVAFSIPPEVKKHIEALAEVLGEKPRVLVVDDEKPIAKSLADPLVLNGFDVTATIQPHIAMQVAKEFQPHIALLGYMMPGLTGADLALELNEFAPGTKLVITNEQMPKAVSSELSRREVEFEVFPAPFTSEALAERMGSWAHHPTIVDIRTGLYNGRYLNFMLDTEIHRCARYGFEFSMIFLDADLAGGRPRTDLSIEQQADAFRKIAGLLKRSCRLIDLAFRSEYQEFALLFPQTPKGVARENALKLLEAIHLSFPSGVGEDVVRLTPRIVVVSFPADGREKRGLFVTADQGIGALKGTGRGGVADAGGVIVRDPT